MSTGQQAYGQRASAVAIQAALQGAKPYYAHFKYNFVPGSKHFSEGDARGPYGKSKERQAEQESLADEMVSRICTEQSADLTASGLGYSEHHPMRKKYLSLEAKANKARDPQYPRVLSKAEATARTAAAASSLAATRPSEPQQYGAAPGESSSAAAAPAAAPKRVTGWYEDEPAVVAESDLCLAAGLGYGNVHPYVSLGSTRFSLCSTACPLVGLVSFPLVPHAHLHLTASLPSLRSVRSVHLRSSYTMYTSRPVPPGAWSKTAKPAGKPGSGGV